MKRKNSKLAAVSAPIAALTAYVVFAIAVVHESTGSMIEAVKAMA